MKIKTTNKYLNNMYKNVFRAGYCDLQYIMRGIDPVYYNSGVYGWNYDAYVDFESDTVITTGYRNMTGATIPSELIEKYTENAKKIIKNYSFNEYEKEVEELEKNRRAFFAELLRK